ncbi:MAG: hypothetical protein SYC29_06075 [Planctomycetota bacterium]|nr:hypothetical protein [Planctomycetota bacterium]
MPDSCSRRLSVLLAVFGILAPARAQEVPGPREAPPEGQRVQATWQVALGVRVHQVDQILPLVDRVVLVPDAATYLHEIGNWSPEGRWPVLIEDDHLAPMFIRAFQPAEVIRRERVSAAVMKRPREARIQEAVVRMWGGTPGTDTIVGTLQKTRFVPPGLVVTSAEDPAWTAAVALAAGRGQPIAWIDEPFGRPGETLNAQRTEALRRRIDQFVAALGLPYAELGDAIETITLCRAVAGRANLLLPESAQPMLRSARLNLPQEPGPPYAITDLIGRHEDGRRYAVTGWIFGDQVYCAYAAMCSLFLPRTDASLISMYPTTDHWAAFEPSGAARALIEAGYNARLIVGADMRALAWQSLLSGGLSSDVILMNTSGMPDYFDLVGDRAYPQDVPILNEPAALHLIHSWAFNTPEDPHTVGGRWRARGAYAMVGAMDEPFLAAFVTPGELVTRFSNYGPFLVSARHYRPHPFSAPWKVNTLGDPLMMMPRPEAQRKERIRPGPTGGTNVTEQTRALMRACDEADAGAETFAAAIAALDLLGRDSIAVQLWRVAEDRGFAAEAARPALGPLFRQNERTAFLRAFRAAPAHDARDRDMLWHLMGARLRVLRDEDTARLLASTIRPPNVAIDLRRLAPRLASMFGDAYVLDLIEHHLQQVEEPLVRAELLSLRAKYEPVAPTPGPSGTS